MKHTQLYTVWRERERERERENIKISDNHIHTSNTLKALTSQTIDIGAKCPGLSGTITEMDGKKLSRTDSNNVIDLSRFGKKYYSKRCLPRKRVEVLLHLLLRKQSEIVTTTIPGPPGSREFVGARRGLHTLVVLCASQTLRFLNDIHDESIVGGAYGRGLSRIFVLESWHLCIEL